jgi:hypothetical protein
MTGGAIGIVVLTQMVVLAVPAVAATLAAIRLGVRSEPVLLGIALAASGGGAMLTFWAYMGPRWLGTPCAYALFFGSVAVAVWAWPRARGQRALLRSLAVPLGLWAVGGLFIVYFGLLHGGGENALETATSRFATDPTPFATDSSIPLFFAEWLFAGHHGPTPVFEPEWLFSDRPPLQIGYVLTQHSFGWDAQTLHYETLGVLLQQLWIVGAWAVLVAAKVGRRTRGLVIVGLMLSDVVIVNSFYVWPKLLGSAFVLAALALLLDRHPPTLRRAPGTAVLLGALIGLAYMSHGTAAFGLVPVVVLAIWWGLPDWRWCAAGVAAIAIVVAPWLAYQHWGDPPGTRLAKWALAGSPAIDERGLLETLGDEYGKEGVGGTIDNKLQNFLTMVGGNPINGKPPPEFPPVGPVPREIEQLVSAVGEGNLAEADSRVREIRHYHLLWTLGLLLIGLPVILVGRLRAGWRSGVDWAFARWCALVFAIGTVVWGLLMFGNVAGRALVTQDCLALPLIGMAAVIAGLQATYPRWAAWLVGLNAVTVLALYTPYLGDHPGYSYSGFAIVVASLSIAAFVALSFAWAPEFVKRWWRGSASSG